MSIFIAHRRKKTPLMIRPARVSKTRRSLYPGSAYRDATNSATETGSRFSFHLRFFVSSNVKWALVKLSLRKWGLPLKINISHHLIKCSWVNKKYKANRFLKMFPDKRKNFCGLKHLLEKMTAVASHVWVMVDHTHCPPKLMVSHQFFDQCL